jgi:hypothetical protein
VKGNAGRFRPSPPTPSHVWTRSFKSTCHMPQVPQFAESELLDKSPILPGHDLLKRHWLSAETSVDPATELHAFAQSGQIKSRNVAGSPLLVTIHSRDEKREESISCYTGATPVRKLLTITGAGEGNRTLVSGLGSPRSTIEPHPLRLPAVVAGSDQQCNGYCTVTCAAWAYGATHSRRAHIDKDRSSCGARSVGAPIN